MKVIAHTKTSKKNGEIEGESEREEERVGEREAKHKYTTTIQLMKKEML